MDNVLPVNVPDSCEEGGGGGGVVAGEGCVLEKTSAVIPQLLSLHTGH